MISSLIPGAGSFVPSTEVYLQLLRFGVTLAIGLFLTRAGLMPLARYLVRRRGGEKKAVHSLENIAALIGIFISFTAALQAANFGSLVTVIGAVAAAATVAVGFGMRDQVASVVAGIFIHTDNPFVKGDYIKVGETEGMIKNISLRTTTLNGKGNEKQIVPNNILTTNTVKNFTKGRKTKVSVETKIESDKADNASEMLLKSIQESEETLDKPEPGITYRKIEEGKTDMEAKFWISDSKDVKEVRSEVLKGYSKKAEKKGLFKKEEKKE